ncbi:MAG: hypothetical protein RJA22_74 [Verrucomicrobiota bacterium]
MALARILVDGYSLLHHWEALAPGRPRHSAAAREELVHILTQYQDACGTPLTIVFDGSGPKRGPDEAPSRPEMEILFTRGGQTADQVIERVAVRLQPYGEVLVVTNDHAERDTVINFGGMAASCESFIRQVETTLGDLQNELKHYNQKERTRFRSR